MLVMPNGQPQVAQQSQQQYNVDSFQNWAKDRYGRAANPQELAQIGQKVGPAQNGQYSEDQWKQATSFADEIATKQGWKQKTTTSGPGPNPSGVPPAYQAPNAPFQPNYNPAQFSQFNAQPYQQAQFSQFKAPDQSKQTGQRNQLFDSIMGNARPFDQQFQDQMFEQQKEQANSMAKQMGLQAQQQMGGRGFALNGGQAQRMQQDVNQQLISDLLAGRRNIATQAAGMNRDAEMQAMGMANDVLNSDQARAIQNYNATLQGQQLQANEAKFANDDTRADFLAMLQGQQVQDDANFRGAGLGMQAFMNNEQLKQAGAGSALQHWLAGQGNELEQKKFEEMQNQFKKTFGLDLMRFGENTRQFNDTMGLNWYNAQGNQQRGIMDFFNQYFQ